MGNGTSKKTAPSKQTPQKAVRRGLDKTLSITILGDPKVGKTALLDQFVDNTFFKAYAVTKKINIRTRIIENEGKIYRLMISDIPGEEKFKPKNNEHITLAHGYLILFDLTNRDSFTHVEKWMDEIKKEGVLSPKIVLVGTKCDLTRAVPLEEIQEYCTKNSLSYIEISSKKKIKIHRPFFVLSSYITAAPSVISSVLQNHQQTPADSIIHNLSATPNS